MTEVSKPDERRREALTDVGTALVVVGVAVALLGFVAGTSERAGPWPGLSGIALVLAGVWLVRRYGRPSDPARPGGNGKEP